MTGQRHSFGAPVLARIIRDKDQPPVAASSARLRECGRRLTHIMPRTHNNLFEQITSFDNLWAAYLDARRGKRYRPEVAQFAANLEENLLSLHNHLTWGSWQPGRAREFRVFEPKQRDIQAPPFADRIVHHALVRVVEPLFERRFIHHSYACRVGKGAQRAVHAVQAMIRAEQRRSARPWIIKADIKSYFASIRHDVLFDAVARVISCRPTIALWRRIARAYGHEAGIGLPVGALTSQLAANVVLDQLDHAITDHAGVGRYVRYMDDTVIVLPSKSAAQAVLVTLEDEVTRLGLRLNPKTRIFPAQQGVDFCGYRAWATHILPRKTNTRRARRDFQRLQAAYAAGLVTLHQVRDRLMSYLAYAKHCSAHALTAGLLDDLVLTPSNNPYGA